MTGTDRRLLEDLENQVRDSADRFTQETTGVRPAPVVEVIESAEPEKSNFGFEFGDVESQAESAGGDCPDCPDCPSGCDFSQTVTGAVSGVPATLDVCTPDNTGWV